MTFHQIYQNYIILKIPLIWYFLHLLVLIFKILIKNTRFTVLHPANNEANFEIKTINLLKKIL
ncbi:hypothetical protein CQS02_05865 [Elizabethkingia miricola]|nr:hypothetical protein CQS02_05865 [Elizabethkingia miricola]